MKRVFTLVVAGMLATGIAVANEHPVAEKTKAAQPAKITLQTMCPVMGGKINKDLYVDHDGKRIYVCCKGCIAPIKKDPVKVIKQLEAEGVTVAHVQTMCPVMGGKINKELYVDHGGKRIYVCCKGCIAPIKKDPKKFIKKMEDEGVVLLPSALPKEVTSEK